MNRYVGNSGVVERIPERGTAADALQAIPATGRLMGEKKPSSHSLLGKGLGGVLSKLGKAAPEFEDLLLIATMYMLYRETGDIEFLLIGGAILIL